VEDQRSYIEKLFGKTENNNSNENGSIFFPCFKYNQNKKDELTIELIDKKNQKDGNQENQKDGNEENQKDGNQENQKDGNQENQKDGNEENSREKEIKE